MMGKSKREGENTSNEVSASTDAQNLDSRAQQRREQNLCDVTDVEAGII